MQIKGFFSNSSALFQSGILLYFVLIGVLLNSAAGYLIINISGFSSTPFYTRLTLQFFSAILIFILPAICTAFFCSKKPAEFIYIKKSVDIRILLLAIAMFLFMYPLIGIASDLNSKIEIPEFFPSISEYMRKADYRAAKATDRKSTRLNSSH